MQDMSVILASYDHEHVNLEISTEDAVVEFTRVVQESREHSVNGQTLQDVFKFIEDSKKDVTHCYNFIIAALQSQDCCFNTQDCWLSAVDFTNKSILEKNAIIKGIIDQLHSSVQANFTDACAIMHSRSWLGMPKAQELASLNRIKDDFMQNSSKMFTIYTCMSYKDPEHFTDEDRCANLYFLRARYKADLSWLFFLHQDNPEKLMQILAKAKQLYFSFQQKYAEKAKQKNTAIKEQFGRLPRELSWIEMKDISNAVRTAKESLELEIRDDVELIDLAHNRIIPVYRCSSQFRQEMLDVDSKLQNIIDHVDLIVQNTGSNEFYFESIRKRLLQLIENIRHAGLEEQIYSEYLLSEYEKFTAQCEDIGPIDTRKNGLLFVIRMVKHINDCLEKKLEIKKLYQNISKEKDFIMGAVNQEPLDYLVARKKLLRELQKVITDIHLVNDLNSQLGMTSYPNIIKTDPLEDALNWISSHTVKENIWIDSRNQGGVGSAAQYRKSLSVEDKFILPASIMAYEFVLEAIIYRLGLKNRELSTIERIKRKLSEITFAPSEDHIDLAKSKISLLEVSSAILAKIESELTDLTVGRGAVMSQSLKIYFNEWKIKSGYRVTTANKHKTPIEGESIASLSMIDNLPSIDALSKMCITFVEEVNRHNDEKRSSSPFKVSGSSIFNTGSINSSSESSSVFHVSPYSSSAASSSSQNSSPKSVM